MDQQRKPAAFPVTITEDHTAAVLDVVSLSLCIHHVHRPGKLSCVDCINELPWPLVQPMGAHKYLDLMLLLSIWQNKNYIFVKTTWKNRGRKKSEVKLFTSPGPYLRGCHGLAALPHWRTQFLSGGPLPTAILSGDPLPFPLSPKEGSGFSVLLVLRTVPSLVVSPIPYHTFIKKLYIKLYSVITCEGAFCFLLGKCWLTNSGVIQLPGSNYFSKC